MLYLVGTDDAYVRYLRETGLVPEAARVKNVQEPGDLEGFELGRVVFLKDFEVLKDWREIYNTVIAHQTAHRMDVENERRWR